MFETPHHDRLVELFIRAERIPFSTCIRNKVSVVIAQLVNEVGLGNLPKDIALMRIIADGSHRDEEYQNALTSLTEHLGITDGELIWSETLLEKAAKTRTQILSCL